MHNTYLSSLHIKKQKYIHMDSYDKIFTEKQIYAKSITFFKIYLWYSPKGSF